MVAAGISPAGLRVGENPPVRVAMTMTQCWHRVPGGTATSIVELARALCDRDDVELVAVGARGAPSHDVAPPHGVATVSLPLGVRLLYDAWDRTGMPTIEPAAAAVLGEVDLVHLTVPMGPPRSSVPLVATVHDLFPLSRPEWFTRRGVRLMAPALERIRDRADAVIVPSAAVARDCVVHGFSEDRLHVVPWGSRPVELDERGAAAARRRLSITGDYVLFVGTVEPRKGLAVLADALARLGRPDLTLVIVGPSGWGPDTDAALAAVPGPVRRLGFLPADDLTAVRAGASVCAVPSWAEGFGLPALEALAAGAPLVTSAGTALEEVAAGAALLVPPGRSDLLADALRRILDESALARRLAEAGPARAAELTWDAAAAAVADVYRSVLR